MRRPVLAFPAIAAVAALAVLPQGTGCSATKSGGVLSSGVAPVGTSVQGPFGTTCTIVQKGIAKVTFHNTAGRAASIKRYQITMQDNSKKQISPRHIHFKTAISIAPHTLYKSQQSVTDRAISCQIEHTNA